MYTLQLEWFLGNNWLNMNSRTYYIDLYKTVCLKLCIYTLPAMVNKNVPHHMYV